LSLRGNLIALALIDGRPQAHLQRRDPVQRADLATAEGFGGSYTSGAFDIGTAVIHVSYMMSVLRHSAL